MRTRRFTSLKLSVCLAVALLMANSTPIIAEDEDTTVEDAAPAEEQQAELTLQEMIKPCGACHGEDGNTSIATYPNMGGQNAKYLERQMLLMRAGERHVPLMAGQLDSMTDENIREIAEFYASKPKMTMQAKPDLIELGESIYRGGILKKNVAACTACHTPNGDGNALAGFPRIAGQHTEYTVAQLKAYREDQRTSDEDFNGMMRDVAKNMTDTEMQAVANYIKGLY